MVFSLLQEVISKSNTAPLLGETIVTDRNSKTDSIKYKQKQPLGGVPRTRSLLKPENIKEDE